VEVVEPRHRAANALGVHFFGQVFVVLTEVVDLGAIVQRDTEGITTDAEVAFEGAEEVLGQMRRVPVTEGRGKALAQHIGGGLGEKGQGHTAVPDVQVEGAGPVPAEGLVVVKKLFDMPALRVVAGKAFDFGTIRSAKEGFELPLIGALVGSLDQLVVDVGGGGGETEGLFEGGKTRPTRDELALGKSAQGVQEGRLHGHGDEEIEGGMVGDAVEQIDGVMLGVGQDEGTLGAGG